MAEARTATRFRNIPRHPEAPERAHTHSPLTAQARDNEEKQVTRCQANYITSHPEPMVANSPGICQVFFFLYHTTVRWWQQRLPLRADAVRECACVYVCACWGFFACLLLLPTTVCYACYLCIRPTDEGAGPRTISPSTAGLVVVMFYA